MKWRVQILSLDSMLKASSAQITKNVCDFELTIWLSLMFTVSISSDMTKQAKFFP